MITFKQYLLETKVEDDFLFGDCASFAYAFQQKRGGEMHALVRNGKALHVFTRLDDKNYDVKGERSVGSMARSIVGSFDGFTVEGPFTKDTQPCRAVSPKKVAVATAYIEKNPTKFGVKT